VVRSGKSKRKPFNSYVTDYLLIIATFAFSYPRVSSDAPSFAAFTSVARGVRFNALAIFLTPIFLLCWWIDSNASLLATNTILVGVGEVESNLFKWPNRKDNLRFESQSRFLTLARRRHFFDGPSFDSGQTARRGWSMLLPIQFP
jgi:hypothetical protein